MSFKQMAVNALNNALTNLTLTEEAQENITKIQEILTQGTYNGLYYQKVENTKDAVLQSVKSVYDIYDRNITKADNTNTYTSAPAGASISNVSYIKAQFDSVKNQIDFGVFAGYGTSVRLYTNSSTYSTISLDLFKSLYGDYLMLDYHFLNILLTANAYKAFFSLYDTSDEKITLTTGQTGTGSIAVRFTNGTDVLEIPIIAPDNSNYYGGSSKARYIYPPSRAAYNPVGGNGYAINFANATSPIKSIALMYTAVDQGVSILDNNEYTLAGSALYYCTNSSQSYPFIIIKKSVVDTIITDLKNLTSLNVTYTGNIPSPTPPGPEPGEALPTEPGQPDNDTDNTGGLGENIGDAIEYPTTPFGATGMGSITYLLDYVQFEKVLHSFYDPTIFTTLTELTMNSVISVNLWPMVLSGQSADYGGVIIGNTPISFSGLGTGHTTTKQVQPNDLYTYNFGTISIPKNQYYGGFLDFEPYTSIQIYLPYCGIQTIKAHDVIGHSITLFVTCDLFTGTGQYSLAVDYTNKNGGTSYAIKYKWPCMVSQPIKITGSNMATLQQALTQNAGQFIKGITSNPASLISGTIGALHDTLSGQQQMASSQGDSLDRYLPQTPYLMITRPNTVVPNDYNKNFGRPSLKTMTLNDLVGKGFTTVPNPLLDLSCTEEEKNYITNALQKGVYL